MDFPATAYQPEFLLARLQKLQRFETRRNRNWRSNLRVYRSAESALGNFAQQKIPKHTDPFGAPQLFRIDEVSFDGRTH